MAIFQFFRLNEHKEFNYTPLFYDKEKEEFNERVRKIEEEMGIKKPSGEYQKGIRRGTLRENLHAGKKQNRAGSMRFFIILLILLAAAYLLIFR
ncbi:MAG: hypothetical protein JXB00_01930 [Bacteroidales bacterium]|nr:hypothetical protein [Bacteroidales bacterium]